MTAVALGPSAYVMDPALATWGYYLTFYALNIQGFVKVLIATVADITNEAEAMAYIVTNAAFISVAGIPVTTLLTDDSAGDFNPAAAGAGGKLTYNVNAVCIPVNEVIEFETTWTKQ